MNLRRLSAASSPVFLLAALACAAPDTPARVEVSLVQTAETNPPIGSNEFGDPGGTRFSAGNLIPDSGFEPISMRKRVRVSRTGTDNGHPWFEFDESGGITSWELTTTGLYNGADVRIYRIVDAAGQALPQGSDNYLDLANAAAYTLVGATSVPQAGAEGLPLGGWLDTAYAMPAAIFGTRSNLDYTDARWVENGKTYYYIVTAIGSNSTSAGGTNESDPSTAVELPATPQAGQPTSPHIYVVTGDSFNEIRSVAAGTWYSFQPAVAGATGTVTWELLDADNTPIAAPAGLTFNAATGALGGTATSTPPPTLLRFRATAANGVATRDFILNNPNWTATGGTTRPEPPTNVTATAGDGYVHLTWTASTTPDVVGYRVYRAEVPRAEQRQRVYLAADAPALVKDDYVHFAKRILSADPMWAHPRVRSGSVGESWRGSTGVRLARAVHTATIPEAFRFPGDSCLEVTSTATGSANIGGPYIFYPDTNNGEAGWYSQLEPGRNYRYEVWLRQDGLGNGGQVRLTFNGGYSSIAQTFTVDGEWRLYGFEFTAPARPTSGSHMCPILGFTGSGRLWVDNIRLFRADSPADIAAPFTPPSPLVYDELMASQPVTGEKGMLRSMYVLLNKATMASCLGLHRDAGLTMNWYQSAEGASNMTVPYFLQYALRSGSSPETRMTPWLNISSHMREDEWLALVEYLGAPIDPANPADVAAKPWAYLRYQQRGVTTPWTDEFQRVYLEFANETWHNGAVSDEWFGWGRSNWVHGGAREFGLAAHHFTTYVRTNSPYFGALDAGGKLRFVMGSNYQNYGETAAAGAPFAHALAHTTYVGPKWEVGETPLATYDDHGIQATLLGHAADTALGYVDYRRWREQLAAAGHTMDLLAYEGGPSGYALPGQDASADAHEFSERYGKSLAMGVAALDAWLAAYEAGFSDQAYLGMGIGDYWSSHTQITNGYRPHAGWLALTLRNRFASGRMIRSNVVQAPTIPWDATEYPLVSSYSFREGNRLCVFLLSRKLGGVHDGIDFGDGSTPVTLVLPANPIGPATLYHLSGDPRATNRDAMNVTIQQTIATLARETVVNLPEGSIHLYVVDTDLANTANPPPPASSPAVTYASTGSTLAWTAVTGASGYTIFRSTKPYFDRADVSETFTVTAPTFTDSDAVGGTTYYYRVAANNDWGTGFWSLVAAGGTNPSAPLLPAPSLDGLLETTGALVANWSEVSGAVGYRVGIATQPAGPYAWTDTGIATSWTFSGLESGRSYFVVSYAYNNLGRGPDSAERTGIPLVEGQTAVLAAWEGEGALVYSTNLANPPLTLPVGRHLLALGASDLTRGPGASFSTSNYGFSNGHYDGKFPFEATADGGNFGATGGGSLANVIAREVYVGCTITPAVGQSVSISGIDTGFQYSFGSRNEPIRFLQAVLRYRVGSGEWHDVAAPAGYAVEPGSWIFNDLSLALAGEQALQSVTAPIELRFYLYWTGADARWHPASLNRQSGEDLVIRGLATTVAAPGVPAGIRTASSRHRVAISWTPVAGATSYTLRWGTAPGVYTGSVTGLTQATATIDDLPGGVPHYFVVEAINEFGSSGSSAEAVVTPLTSYQSWQTGEFTTAQIGAGSAAPDADPDADGRSNLEEYAFRTSPSANDNGDVVVHRDPDTGLLSVSLPVYTDNDDIDITVETSVDLVNWVPLARSEAGAAIVAIEAGVSVSSSGGVPNRFTVTDAPGGAIERRRFLRLRITAR